MDLIHLHGKVGMEVEGVCFTRNINPDCLHINDEDFKLILFGTGIDFYEFVAEMRFMFSICEIQRKFDDCIGWIVDNDVTKHSTFIFGVKIDSPNILRLINNKHMIVITSSSYYQEIAKQMQDMGFKEYSHFLSGDKYIHILLNYLGIFNMHYKISSY